jgi:2-polyprenyl-6-methoxyphenol hydroxylase-like FAD-dependent oxidoreductase
MQLPGTSSAQADMFQTMRHHMATGYGIHIDIHGKQALRSCLPQSHWEEFMSHSTPAGTQMFFRDSQLHLLAEKDDAKIAGAAGDEHERRAITRDDLREILLRGLDDTSSASIVQWSKAATYYDQSPDERVRLWFSDGSCAEGDVLVGADGPQSAIQRQYLPAIERMNLGVQTIAGRCSISSTDQKSLPSTLLNGSLNNIVPAGKGWMFISTWSSSRAHVEICKDQRQIVWAYVVPHDIAAAHDLTHTPPCELQRLVLGAISTWSPLLIDIVQRTDPKALSRIPLRTMPTLQPWEPTTVTLMGDAIHNMTPMAGKGANTALRDAETLSEALLKAASGETSLVKAIGDYEATMRRYANRAIQLSLRNALSASSVSSVERRAFRGILRIARKSPFVMRRTLGRSVVLDQ